MEESVSQKEKERAEEAMIEQAFQELLNDYLATKHRKRVEIITKAFNFANQAHKGIKRRSGEPYIMHPIAVAKIVCNEIGLGSTSICAALLHDVVEDTDYTARSSKGKSSSQGDVTYHRIRNGETLSTIARKYGVTVSQIKSWNGLRSTRINAGKRLKIYK